MSLPQDVSDGQLACGASDERSARGAPDERSACDASDERSACDASDERSACDASDGQLACDVPDERSACDVPDEQLAVMLQQSRTECLAENSPQSPENGRRLYDSLFAELHKRFIGLMLSMIGSSAPCGMDADDLMQECSLGLLSAALSYRTGGGASFSTYAYTCISNRLRSALRRGKNAGNAPLADYEPLSDFISSEEDGMYLLPENDPAQRILIEESVSELHRQMADHLSKVEYSVFDSYLSGMSYDDIAQRLSIRPKAVDNALHRARRKLKAALHDRGW